MPPKVSYVLRILGAGPLEARWKKLSRQLGVADRCQWLGWLPRERAMKLYEWADVFVFTSLRETTGTVVLEALSRGVPVICLDHQGVRYVVTEACGIKIPVISPGAAISGLRDAVLELATDAEKIRKLSKGAAARARHFLWSRNGQELAKLYHSVLLDRRRSPAREASHPGGGIIGDRKDVDITVVVVTYNRATMLRQALETLITQRSHSKFSFEILVIDDGSTDDTASVVREMATQAEPLPIRYVYKEGGGEGDARNRGVAEAQGQWIAFCDDDQQADPGWLAQLYEAAREKGALCVGGSVSLVAPDLGRIMLGPRARRFLGEKRLSANLSSPEAKLFLGAGNLLVHRSVFTEVGGFDPALRQGVDTDFFWRVEQAGFSLGAAPGALVYHVIPTARVQLDYLRRLCLRKGVATHQIQSKYASPAKTIRAMFTRLGIAFAVNLPLLALAALVRDKRLSIDSRCGLWYKIGFIRAGLYTMAPNIFRQERFFQDLELGYHGAHR
jgi:glycosyltransferase involved in cell wall biosynthesis